MASTEGVRTRSGRISKPPERYSPIEDVTDDYSDEDEDDEEFYEEEDSESDDEEDSSEDSDGSLKDFIEGDEEA